MVRYEGLSADDVWQDIASSLLESPEYITTSRCGEVIEVLQCAFSIQNPRRRWIISRRPAYNPAYGLVEFVWILNGKDDGNVLRFWNPGLSHYVGTDEILHGAYGHRLRRHFKIDQIRRAYLALKSNPASRQVALQIWDPAKDLPDDHGAPASQDVPCNIVALLKIRENRLHWTQVMRSNDVIRGLPYNIIQFTLLHEAFASWLQCEIGPYVHFSDSMHMYKSDIQNFHVSKQSPCHDQVDSHPFGLSYDDTMSQLNEIYERLTLVSELSDDCNREILNYKLTDTFHPINGANKYRSRFLVDMMCIIGSDAARRLGASELAHELLANCHERELRTAGENWLTRNANNAGLA